MSVRGQQGSCTPCDYLEIESDRSSILTHVSKIPKAEKIGWQSTQWLLKLPLEVTHVTSAHISLAEADPLDKPDFKGYEGNPSPREGLELQIYSLLLGSAHLRDPPSQPNPPRAASPRLPLQGAWRGLSSSETQLRISLDMNTRHICKAECAHVHVCF